MTKTNDERGTRPLTAAQLEQRSAANLRHGARSTAQIAPAARAQRRRFLRRNGLNAHELDGITAGYLDAWARCAAKVELLDRYIAEHGLLNEKGEMPGFMTLYVSLVNSCRLSLAKLEERIESRPPADPLDALTARGQEIIEARVVRDTRS